MLPLLYIWDSKAMYIGTGFETGVHAHNAFQVIIALDGKTKVEIEGTWIENSLFLLKPNTNHRIQLLGNVAMFLVDAEVSRLTSITQGSISSKVIEKLKSCFLNPYETKYALKLFEEVLSELGFGSILNSSVKDDRIQKCLEYIEVNLNEELNMESLCKVNGLSESSFSHLFSKEVGIPFRRYLLWKRLKKSISIYLDGRKSLTEVSQEMGFSDQAHFSNAFKDVFGIRPTFILRNKLRLLHNLKRLKIS
jgi:AraC family transcriptional regulator